MSVWTLASEGRHGALHIGQTWDSVQAQFGPPTDWATNNSAQSSLFKYDAIELLFADGRLWALSCEIGGRWFPDAVRSAKLGIEPEGLRWPTTIAELTAIAATQGVALVPYDEPSLPDAHVVKGGLATIQLFGGDNMLTWGISKRLSDEPS